MFKLPNGITCLLVNDLNTELLEDDPNNVAVSVAVNAGSFNDPSHRQGLAHFLEHMIFMGSEKYPDENAFSNFISAKGGESNAYTMSEYTNYHFKVNYENIEKALDL